jgi:hypothetical protein
VYKCKWRERIRNFKKIKKEILPYPLPWFQPRLPKKGGLSFGLDNVGNIFI